MRTITEEERLKLSHEDFLRTFQYPIVFLDCLGSWQGDYVVLFYNPLHDLYGWLVWGYGSCTGCDEFLYAQHDSLEKLQHLQEILHARIGWFSREDLLEYITHHDWQGDFLATYGDELTVVLGKINDILEAAQ